MIIMQCRVAALIFFLNFFTAFQSAPHEGLPLLNPGGIGGIFKGPDSETIIRGPDGSEITADEKGGSVIRDDLQSQPIIVAEPEVAPVPILTSGNQPPDVNLPVAPPIITKPTQPLLLSDEIYASNVISTAAPPILEPQVVPIKSKRIDIVEQDPHVIETEIVAAPDVESDQESDLKGPSGRIITKGSASIVSGPASTTITEPRKVVIAPIKISKEVPVITVADIPIETHAIRLQSTTATPSVDLSAITNFQHSVTTPAYGYSTVSSQTIGEIPLDSNKIDLGPGRHSIGGYSPVIEYDGASGVLNDRAVSVPELSRSFDGFSTVATPIIAESPTSYLVPPPPPPSTEPLLYNDYDSVYGASSPSPFIQKIPKSANIVLDGRVDMGYRVTRTPAYRLPQILNLALSEIYGKSVDNKNKEKSVVIDDKLGELSQNEINDKLFPTIQGNKPDLTQSKYIGPALLKNGVDLAQVNLAPVPLSQVAKFQEY